MRRESRLADWLFEGGERPLREVAGDQRLLVRRLILAEVLAPPISLRRPGESTPLSSPAEAPGAE